MLCSALGARVRVEFVECASSGLYSVRLDIFPSPTSIGIEFKFFENLIDKNTVAFYIAHSRCKYLFFSRFRLLITLRYTLRLTDERYTRNIMQWMVTLRIDLVLLHII